MRSITITYRALAALLQDPHKRILIATLHRNAAIKQFHDLLDQIMENDLDHLKAVKTALKIVTPEGGFIKIESLRNNHDIDRLRGYEFDYYDTPDGEPPYPFYAVMHRSKPLPKDDQTVVQG